MTQVDIPFCLIKDDDLNETLVNRFGEENVNSILRQIALPPSTTTLRVCKTTGESIEEIIEQLKEIVDIRFKDKIKRNDLIDDCIEIPCIGPLQPENDLSIPQVAVDKMAGAALLRGADLFAPGVIALSDGAQNGSKVAVYIDLDKTLAKYSTKRIRGRKLFIGNGILKQSRSEIFSAQQKDVAVELTEPLFSSPSLSGVLNDKIFLQNLPSMIVAHALKPQPNDLILDMCAAPGGKTTHLCSLMGNDGTGRVIACDKSRNRSKLLLANLRRFHCDSKCSVLRVDAAHVLFKETGAVPVLNALVDNDKSTTKTFKFQPEMFDRILLDPPCSGLGQRPTFEIEASLSSLQANATYQRAFIKTAIQLLKPGGRLTYSTCSFYPDENEGNVQFMLETFPEMKLIPVEPKIGGDALEGFGFTLEQRRMMQRFHPDHKLDSIGFFIACFEKSTSNLNDNNQK